MGKSKRTRPVTAVEYPEWIIDCMQHQGDRESLISKLADHFHCPAERITDVAPNALQLTNYFHEMAGPSIFSDDVIKKLAKYWFLCVIADRLERRNIGKTTDQDVTVYVPSGHIAIAELFNPALRDSKLRTAKSDENDD